MLAMTLMNIHQNTGPVQHCGQ